MAKRIIIICLWTVAFILGIGMLLGVASFFHFAISSPTGEQTGSWMVWVLAFFPMVGGLVGLALGVLGLLPGTRRRCS
jgi:hypothetical protein